MAITSPILQPENAQKLIIVGLVITASVTIIEIVGGNIVATGPAVGPLQPGQTRPNTKVTGNVGQVLVGSFVAGVLLLGMSYFLPEFATGLAVVTMTATVFSRGAIFWALVTKVTGAQSSTPSPTPKG